MEWTLKLINLKVVLQAQSKRYRTITITIPISEMPCNGCSYEFVQSNSLVWIISRSSIAFKVYREL